MVMHGYLARVLPALLEARRVRRNPTLQWEEVGRLAEAIRRLSSGFTGERTFPGERYLSDDDLFDAYLLYYFPITYAKLAQVLAEVTVSSPTPRALDLGSGPGPGALALGHRLGPTASIVAADREMNALGALRGIWKGVGAGQLQTFLWKFPDALPASAKDFDLIVAANLLNELSRGAERRVESLAQWLRVVSDRLRPKGSLVLVEPALRETSRILLEVRDVLVKTGFVVSAPCFWTGPCPALLKARDWCHAARPWAPPEWVRVLGEEAGLSVDRINFSYLILARGKAAAPAKEPLARVISDPILEAGKRKIWVCGEDVGRRLVTRLDKLASIKNADFDTAERGDVIAIEGARPLSEELRLDGDSEFRRLHRTEPEDLPMPRTRILIERE